MPFKHFISTQPDIERAVKEIKKELNERLEFFKKDWKEELNMILKCF